MNAFQPNKAPVLQHRGSRDASTIGGASDAGTLEANENVEDDNNDSDFMYESGDENSDSTKDDVSLADENDINLDHEVLEKTV